MIRFKVESFAPHAQLARKSSPLLRMPLAPGRAWLIKGLLYLAFALLAGRALWVQVITTQFYQHQGNLRFLRTIELPAMRGRILDRRGYVLASSIQVQTIWADPEDMEATPQQIDALARLLGMDRADLQRRLNLDRQFVFLKRQVDADTAHKVQALGIKGLGFLPSYTRFYPEGEAAAQLLGFTDIDNNGQSGLELALQQQLAGKPGNRKVLRDRLGHVIEDVDGSTPPIDGKDLQLTIDSKVQDLTYQALKQSVLDNKAKTGSAVVLDARSGEVLAMANYPSFDPNNHRAADPIGMRNFAVSDTYEPGSVMKPITIAAALQNGLVTPQSLFNTGNGCANFYGNKICDDSRNGVIALPQVIQFSSNIGTGQIVQRMNPQMQWDMYAALGLGQKPQLPFPGLAGGRLRPWQKWRPIEAVTQGFGYGVSASTLQLAHAYLVFANHGAILPVSLISSDAAPRPVQVLSPQVATEMRSMLQLVTAKGGTAHSAAVPGYSTGGKTGTAYIWHGHGYDKSQYRAQFVGISPIDSPRLVMAVSVDQPHAGKHFGGEVSAPVFAVVIPQVLRQLGVTPDLPVQQELPGSVAKPVQAAAVAAPAPKAVAKPVKKTVAKHHAAKPAAHKAVAAAKGVQA